MILFLFTAEGKVKQGKGTHVVINCLFVMIFIVKEFNVTSYALGEHFRHYCLLKKILSGFYNV